MGPSGYKIEKVVTRWRQSLRPVPFSPISRPMALPDTSFRFVDNQCVPEDSKTNNRYKQLRVASAIALGELWFPLVDLDLSHGMVST
jgi:hypothetical protein